MTVPPSERALAARIAANESWAATPDRTARTAPGRAAFLARFEAQVDPDNALDPIERARRAEHARKAHMQRLALKSARSRRLAREHAEAAAAADAELDQLEAAEGGAPE